MDRLDQHMAEFSNGDLLIGNSSTAALRSGDENGVLILHRIDNCGNVKWVKEYTYNDGYLVLNDIAVNENDEIFLFGRNNSALTESIFIVKIDDPLSGRAELKIFNPGSVDNFTYSMDVNNNSLMVHGLLFDFNSSKEGFIGIFDHNLNFEKGYKFVPFESTGDAIFSSDGGVVGRSGPYVYKFDKDNNIQWAFKTIGDQDLQNIAGPLETDDGWIFESHNAGKSFLYKLDNNGELKWKSQSIEKTNIGGDLIQLASDKIMFAYNTSVSSGTALSFFGMDGFGLPIDHRTVDHSFSMNTGVIKQRFKDGFLSVIGSKAVSAPGTAEIENFILQFDLDEQDHDCFSLEPAITNNQNMFDLETLSLENLDVRPEEFTLELIDRIIIRETPGFNDHASLCDLGTEVIPQVESKTLPCIDSWDVSLPSDEYIWDDNFENVQRELKQPGIYVARSIDCTNQEILEYHLEKEECGCNIYLPNVFTPDEENNNSELELGIFCDLETLDLSIFDRWGQRVFTSNSIDRSWKGKINLSDAPAGVYSALLDYSWIDGSGMEQREKIIQTVTVLR